MGGECQLVEEGIYLKPAYPQEIPPAVEHGHAEQHHGLPCALQAHPGRDHVAFVEVGLGVPLQLFVNVPAADGKFQLPLVMEDMAILRAYLVHAANEEQVRVDGVELVDISGEMVKAMSVKERKAYEKKLKKGKIITYSSNPEYKIYR